MIPKISIVLPVFNPKLSFLQEALESIQLQEYSNLEVVISDDTDGDTNELQNFIDSHSEGLNTIYIKNNNERGVFGNINNAISISSGEYIQLFSQDDVMYDQFLKGQLAPFFEHSTLGMVFNRYIEINENGDTTNKKNKKFYNPGKNHLILGKSANTYFLKFGCLPGNISPVMIKREVYDMIGGFNEKLRYAGDFDYWVRICEVKDMFFTHNARIGIRSHVDRASNIISNHQLLDDLIFIYRKLIDSQPYKSREIERVLLNRTVGAAFIHHAVRKVLDGEWPFMSIVKRLGKLNRYPFRTSQALIGYMCSVPVRIYRKAIEAISGN